MINEEEIVNRLSIYEKLTKKTKDALVEKAYTASFSKHELLPYDCNAAFIYVKKGGMNVYLLGENGEEMFLYRIGRDDACVFNNRFEYEFFANTDLICFDKNGLEMLTNMSLPFENFVLKTQLKHSEDGLSQINFLMFSSVDKRIANYLLSEAVRTRSHLLVMTHEQIARHIGSSREVVTRRLGVLCASGAIETSRGKIHINSRDLLKKFD